MPLVATLPHAGVAILTAYKGAARATGDWQPQLMTHPALSLAYKHKNIA
jgi:hypothetical protein